MITTAFIYTLVRPAFARLVVTVANPLLILQQVYIGTDTSRINA